MDNKEINFDNKPDDYDDLLGLFEEIEDEEEDE